MAGTRATTATVAQRPDGPGGMMGLANLAGGPIGPVSRQPRRPSTPPGQRVTRGFNAIERALRHQRSAPVNAEQGRPHATGVVYAVSRGEPNPLRHHETTTAGQTFKRTPTCVVVPVPAASFGIHSRRSFQGTATVVPGGPSGHSAPLLRHSSTGFW
jgi:hypothetical protein